MDFLQVTVCTTTEASDIVSCILMDEGSEGVSIKDSSDFAELLKGNIIWDYIDEKLLTDDKRVFVSGFFDTKKDLSGITDELEKLKKNCEFDPGSLELTTEILHSEDYENVWKKYYKPIEIGKVVIVPKWINRAPDEHIEVKIDPGMAFGTGSHETTSMCIRLLSETEIEGKAVCDFGCGSGILGITAAKLGAKRVVMSDIDRQAVKASKENAELNGVTERVKIICGDLASTDEQFDVVVANITADVLIRLSKTVASLVKTGGKIIISGIINSRADEVKNAYGEFELQSNLRDGEWQAFSFIKR